MDTTRRALECQEKSFLACKSCFRACFAAHHAFGVLVSGNVSFTAADRFLSAAVKSAGFLERQRSSREQMLDGVEQPADGMTGSRGAQVIGRDV